MLNWKYLWNEIKIYLILKFYSLGAIHDGTSYNDQDASSCNANISIMTKLAGNAPQNESAYLTFSKCSINSFKYLLLTPNYT